MKEQQNTYPLIIQVASCTLIILCLGLIPKPEAPLSEEKKPFKVPSITAFIKPVQVEESNEKSETRQQEIHVFDAIVQ